jgi:hypothetical protein
MTLDHVIAVIRDRLGVADGRAISPRALAAALDLHLVSIAHVRTAVHGDELWFDDAAPEQMQLYLIARAASAHALRLERQLRDHSPHDVAVALCGVSCGPPGGPRRRVASVIKVRPLRRGAEAR